MHHCGHLAAVSCKIRRSWLTIAPCAAVGGKDSGRRAAGNLVVEELGELRPVTSYTLVAEPVDHVRAWRR